MNYFVSALVFILKPIVLFIICNIVIKFISKIVSRAFKKTNLDKGIQSFSKSAIKILLWVIAIIIIAGSLGIETASLVTLLGVASLALSLSVQNIFTNIFSGITILISKPFVVGDYIETCGVSGTVKSINLMRTTINTPDNKVELVPNGDIASSKITNYSTEEERRVDMNFNVINTAKTSEVREVILNIIKSDERILLTNEPFVGRDGDIEYIVRFWVKNSDYWGTYFDIKEKILDELTQKKWTVKFTHIYK